MHKYFQRMLSATMSVCLIAVLAIAPKAMDVQASAASWNFSDSSFNGLGTISSNTSVNGLTLVATSSKNMQVKKKSATVDGTKYSYVLSTKGTGDKYGRAVRVPVSANDVVSVTFSSSSADTRSLTLASAAGHQITSMSADKTAVTQQYTYTGSDSYVLLYSMQGGMNIYKISVASGSSSSSSASTSASSSSSSASTSASSSSSSASTATSSTSVKTTADFVHGSAETPEGTTIVVTVFADGSDFSWDKNDSEDVKQMAAINDYLQIAGDYLEGVTANYGKTANFITDFEKHSDLAYSTSFNADLDGGADLSSLMWSYIDKNIDVNSLMAEYHADNVIFFMAMDTDASSSAVTCTRNWYSGMEYPYEIVFLFNIDYGSTNPPAVYAHEMLHTFGVPDYYYADSYYGTTASDVTWISQNLSNDIMYTCSDATKGYIYDGITNTVSDMTAWYAGLTSTSSTAKKLGLTVNEHFN